jgi:glycyl-tRNA synthetase beta chain
MPDLLIEIGTEEIPALQAGPALTAIAAALRAGAAGRRLVLPEPVLLGTPRRLAFWFEGVEERAPSVTEERRGPAAKAAFDGEGKPTKAAEGFARSAGVAVSDLRVANTDKGAWVVASVRREGAFAADVITEVLPAALRAAGFAKVMRWTGSDLLFARPIRWLVALLGRAVVPVRAAGVEAGRTTRGHRFLRPGPVDLESSSLDDYRRVLGERCVRVDPARRRALILEGLPAAFGRDDGTIGKLLEEVVWLAEWPVVVEGRIDAEFMALPLAVLETAMRVHLRFFPVVDREGNPEPRFFSVMDREECSAALVREGNERVLRSRLSDARFFLSEDRRKRLEERLPALADKAVHRDLGSYAAKAERLRDLAGWLGGELGLDEAEMARAARAALLCKADLLTQMVGEFPELQGVIGRHYALLDGEEPEVAEAIEDHYRPRGPTDALPRGKVATVLSLAEKLDNLAGFFRVAGAPTGSADPFGLRRQALGLLRVCVEKDASFPLVEALRRAAVFHGAPPGLPEAVLDFIRDRFYHAAVEEGFRYDLVRATLGAGLDDVPACRRRLLAVREMSALEWWPRVVTLVERTANILRGQSPAESVDEALLAEPAEKALFAALTRAGPEVSRLAGEQRYAEAGSLYAVALSDLVQEFFARVFVNVEDAALRGNRLALLARIHRLFASRVADLSLVESAPA